MVKCLSILNKALIYKWSRHFANKRGVFFNQVINGEYGEERGGWRSRQVREGYEVGLWKEIRKD